MARTSRGPVSGDPYVILRVAAVAVLVAQLLEDRFAVWSASPDLLEPHSGLHRSFHV